MDFKKIKTFQAACKYLKLDPKKALPSIPVAIRKYHEPIIAHFMLVIIAEACNMAANDGKKWTPDWDNNNQWKYWPWFRMSGSGLSFYDVGVWHTYSIVGSRLCFINRDVAEYVGKQFVKLYETYFCIK